MTQPQYPRRRSRRTRDRKKPSPVWKRLARPLFVLGLGIVSLSVIVGTVSSIFNRPAPAPVTASSPEPIVSVLSRKQELTALSQKIKQLITKPELNLHLLLYEVDNGGYVDINGSTAAASASLIKMPLLVAFLEELDLQTINLSEMLQLTEDVKAGEAGVLQESPIGTKFSAQEVVTLMITESDNTATNMILKRLGGMQAVNDRFKRWGMTQTSFRNNLPDLQGTNTTSPKELVELFSKVEQQQLLSLRSRDLFMDILSQTKNDTLIPSGIDGPARVRHKTGTISTMIGDTALVDLPNGNRYLLTIMVRRPPEDPGAEELIRKISGTIYNQFKTDATPVSPPGATSNSLE